jgi:hypothetical protein
MPTTTPWSDTQKILAIVLVVAFIGVIMLWMFYPPHTDAGSTAVLNTLVGTLGGMTTMVVSFYFGSSRNANTKDNTIAALVAPPSTSESVAPPSVLPHTTPTG